MHCSTFGRRGLGTVSGTVLDWESGEGPAMTPTSWRPTVGSGVQRLADRLLQHRSQPASADSSHILHGRRAGGSGDQAGGGAGGEGADAPCISRRGTARRTVSQRSTQYGRRPQASGCLSGYTFTGAGPDLAETTSTRTPGRRLGGGGSSRQRSSWWTR